MDIRKVKKLIELLEESGIAEIEIKEGEEAVRISRMPPCGAAAHVAPPQPPAAVAPLRRGTRRRAAEAPAAEAQDATSTSSPRRWSGTFYACALARREGLRRDRR